MRDRSRDGAVRGALVGALLGAVTARAVPNGDGRHVLRGAVLYGGIGYLLDRRSVHREPVYAR